MDARTRFGNMGGGGERTFFTGNLDQRTGVNFLEKGRRDLKVQVSYWKRRGVIVGGEGNSFPPLRSPRGQSKQKVGRGGESGQFPNLSSLGKHRPPKQRASPL